jgi:hypothetical protein
VFSVLSVARGDKQAVSGVNSVQLREMKSSVVVRESPASKDVDTEAQAATTLVAVTRRQPVTIQTEKT